MGYRLVYADDDSRVPGLVYYALRDIKKDEELTVSYWVTVCVFIDIL
jgi:hypothetical protein